jgi:hypothetical protein
MEVSGQLHLQGVAPSVYCTGGRADPRAGLDIVGKVNISQKIAVGLLSYPVQSLHRLSYWDSFNSENFVISLVEKCFVKFVVIQGFSYVRPCSHRGR